MKLIGNIIEAFYYMRVVLSPLLVGIIISFILYNTLETPYNAILAVGVMMTAIFLGVKWANWARKKHGSSNYIGRVISTPDLDDIKK